MKDHSLGLKDRIVLITGGAGGIGWRCAELFSQHGARVIACSPDRADITRRIPQANPLIAMRFMDVKLESSIVDIFDNEPLIKSEGLDILVNCAGLQLMGSAEQTTLAMWNAVMDVNVTGAFLTSKYAVSAMKRRGGGSIVNISSIHARVTGGSRVAYVTSKAALLGLTKAMALDGGPHNIRVNVVLPGTIDTPMLTDAWALLRPDKTADEMRVEAGRTNPLGRIGTPDDVADTILFLCSDQARYITGAEILVDGGISQKIAVPITVPTELK